MPPPRTIPLSAGRCLGPYEIVRRIGGGGMGEVYEARDGRLQRRVALKTLRPDLLADSHARRRFEHEARALSALSHPNICTVFDVGHEDGIDFIVMEYIEGDTLSALLDRRTLPEPTLVKYVEQIAEALAEAHDHGVLHRDVKPQNVMVTSRGHVKVLDFGLAKSMEVGLDAATATVSALSDPAVVVGTAPYMSPEQVKGETVDARSDAFSFGSLLYEAIAGRPPFHAPTPAETMSAILTAEPVPLARIAPATSVELQRIVRKCLEKERSRRYQTLRDVAIDLANLGRDSAETARATIAGSSDMPAAGSRSRRRRATAAAGIALVLLLAAVGAGLWRVLGPAGVPGVRSIAILPLKPLSSGVSENYLGLGIADALITRLSGTSDLVVRPTSAVRRYAGQESDALQAGGQLRVDAVLDGTWQRDAERLRVTVNLLRVADGASLWAEQFDLPSSDVFGIQDRVSDQLASRLRLERVANDRPQHTSHGTPNADAYDAYLRGVFYLGLRGYNAANRQNSDAATALLERAIALDPTFAAAHAKVGFALAHTAIFIEDSQALLDRAKRETNTAEALSPDLAQVHLNRAFILWTWYERWRLVDSIREYRRAEQLDPALNDIEATAGYAHLGFYEDWRRVGERVIERDPTNRQARVVFVNERYLLNLPDELLAEQKRLLNEGPDHRYFLLTRRVADAAPLIERNASLNPRDVGAQAELTLLRALQGQHDAARDLTARVLSLTGRNRYHHHVTYTLARVAALRGDADEAARWLEETIAWGFPCYPMFSTDSFLDPVRHSPRVRKDLADLKITWEGYRDALRAPTSARGQ